MKKSVAVTIIVGVLAWFVGYQMFQREQADADSAIKEKELIQSGPLVDQTSMGGSRVNALGMRLPMYDVRCWMYDLRNSRAKCARLALGEVCLFIIFVVAC